MKRIALIFFLICLLLHLSACGKSVKKESSNIELYDIGLDLISVMDEMVKSEEYADIIGFNSVESLAETVDANDYDSPIAVYRVSLPEVAELLKLVGDYDADLWNNLSPNLKNQIENRVSFSTIVSIINAQKGSNIMAFSSIYTASDKSDALDIEETTVLLYVFEEGTPIAITFTESGSINGQFVFLEDVETLSDVKSVFKKYNCSVSKINID